MPLIEVIADYIIPRENFNRSYIKMFLSTSLDGLDVKFIVTDGDNRYHGIIHELGYTQQRMHIPYHEKPNGFTITMT